MIYSIQLTTRGFHSGKFQNLCVYVGGVPPKFLGPGAELVHA